ncbi:hypothetical protein [Lentzea albidocapillata]|nr:hypothetical protein [Lentzea albidocapillata]
MRIVMPVVVCALVVGACGSPQPGSPQTPTAATTSATVPSHSPKAEEGPVGTLDVVVEEPAERANSAVRFLRVENADGKSVVERSFRTVPAELSEYLPKGRYRVVSWIRDCGGDCRSKEDKDLDAPTRICGIRVDVREEAVAAVTVDAPAESDCAMTGGG